MLAKDYNERNAEYFKKLSMLKKSTADYYALRDEIYEFNIKLIQTVMNQFKYFNDWDRDDDSIIAGFRLSHCIGKYDPSRGVTFASYAMKCMTRAVTNCITRREKNKKSKYKGTDVHKVLSYDALSEHEFNPELGLQKENLLIFFDEASYSDSYEELERESIIKFLTPYLEGMTDRQKEIIYAKFFSNKDDIVSDKDLAEQLNVSRQAISLVKKQALKRMLKNIEQNESQTDIDTFLHQ